MYWSMSPSDHARRWPDIAGELVEEDGGPRHVLPIRVYFEERPYLAGPGGAKGIGELPMDGPAPAILNAVAHATGLDPVRLPLTPESLMALIGAARG